MASPSATTLDAAAALWRGAGLPPDALAQLQFTGPAVAAPSSFAVTAAVQASLGLAALAAAELGRHRLPSAGRQQVKVDSHHVVADSQAWFSLDGVTPEVWEKYSGLYPCGGRAHPGWVRLHANFAHHRDAALRLLGLQDRAQADRLERADLADALQAWRADDFEAAAAQAGAVAAAARSFDAWDAHPQAAALRIQPVVALRRVDGRDAEPAPPVEPLPLPPLNAAQRPLHGVRVLDFTRILAGPVAARNLAAYGADVLMLNAPHLPNIASVAEMSRGKRSALLDLNTETGAATLRGLVGQAHVFLQGYRPGGLAQRGWDPATLARLRPGIVCASLSAYGTQGPWAGRRGFDSLVQTATGFNLAEAQAFGQADPRALPFQCLDYSAGHLLAFGIGAALCRQQQEGGSWAVEVTLAGVGHWLRSLGRPEGGLEAAKPELAPHLETVDSGWGALRMVRHAAQLSRTPAGWDRPSVRPGTHAAAWVG